MNVLYIFCDKGSFIKCLAKQRKLKKQLFKNSQLSSSYVLVTFMLSVVAFSSSLISRESRVTAIYPNITGGNAGFVNNKSCCRKYKENGGRKHKSVAPSLLLERTSAVLLSCYILFSSHVQG